MVDVWNELGKVLGRGLKPLKEIAPGIWTAFGDATGDLVKGFMASAEDIVSVVEPQIAALLPDVIAEATAALSEGSPPPEIKESVDKWIKELMNMIAKESKTEGKSLPTGAELTLVQGKLVSGVIAMYAATHAVSIALDATHPLKDWGFKSAIMDMLYQFKMSDVIGPMIQAPIWSSVVVPLRYRANSDYPYKIPDEKAISELRYKGLIESELFHESMKYHAFDTKWSNLLYLNTARPPSFGDLRTMVHRGVKTWKDVDIALQQSLTHRGYRGAYKALIPSIPGVSDLVRFAVREAYPDATGFTEQYAKMSEWMKKLGYDQYFADAFWEAHWIIPSISQADDLLHRGDITEAQHTGLYILNDIRPQDIDKLRSLTWKLPGRIESRWMFRWGEIDATDLRDFLVKDGLDPIYADRVAGAIAKNQFLTDINRQITNIKADYARGYSLEATLRSDLAALGQRAEIVEYHVRDALDDRIRSIADGELRTLRSQYARGAMPMADIIQAVDMIIVDDVARAAWLAALPSAKQVMIMEETFTTEVNRIVANAKYDYVRGYILRAPMISKLQTLGLPDMVIDFHVMDADEDRTRKRSDERLIVIKDMWIKDVEPDFTVIAGWVMEIIVQEEARNLWLDDAYFDKMRTVRIPEAVPVPPAVTVATLRTGFRAGIITSTELAAELTKRGYSPQDVDLLIAVEIAKIKPETYPIMPMSTLKKAFREQIITEEQLRDELESRRYTPDDIAVIVAVEVKSLREELAVMPAQIKTVSVGTLRMSFRLAVITQEQLISELGDRGYSPEDVAVIVEVERVRIEEPIKPPKVPAVPVLSLAKLAEAFREGLTTETAYREELLNRGYSRSDVNIMVTLEMAKLSIAKLAEAFREGVITEANYRAELLRRDFSLGDIDIMVALELAKIEEALEE